MQTPSYPSAFLPEGVGKPLVSWVLWGCHLLRSRRVCCLLFLWARNRRTLGGKGYYLRLLPAQCTLRDNVLIGRDPQTAEVMLSLLRKADGGWRVAGGGWLALPEQICEAFRLLWSYMCKENYRIRNSYNNTAFDPKLNNQILYGDKTVFWH